MTASLLNILDRAANLVGAVVIAVVLLASAPDLTAMLSASHLFGA